VSGGELYRLQRIGCLAGELFFPASARRAKNSRGAPTTQPPAAPAGAAALRRHLALQRRVSRGTRPACLRSRPRRRERRPSRFRRYSRQSRCRGRRPPAHFHGHRRHKFGMDWEDARRLYLAHRDSRWIAWQGLSAHIGSQILTLSRSAGASGVWRICARACPCGRGAQVSRFRRRLGRAVRGRAAAGHYGLCFAQSARRCDRWVATCSSSRDARWSAQPAVLLTRALYTKHNRGKNFVVVDAAMNDFLRPALYGATHPVTSAVRPVESSGSS